MKKSIICLFMIFLVCMIQPAVADTDPFQITMEEDIAYINPPDNITFGNDVYTPVQINVHITNDDPAYTNTFTIDEKSITLESFETGTLELENIPTGTYPILRNNTTYPYSIETTEIYSIDCVCTVDGWNFSCSFPTYPAEYIPSGDMNTTNSTYGFSFPVHLSEDPELIYSDNVHYFDPIYTVHGNSPEWNTIQTNDMYTANVYNESGDIHVDVDIQPISYTGPSTIEVDYTEGYYHDVPIEWNAVTDSRTEVWDEYQKINEYHDTEKTGTCTFSLPIDEYDLKIYSTILENEIYTNSTITVTGTNIPSADIYGYILDSNGQPLPSSVVEAGTKSELSDRHGFFTVDGTGTSDMIVKCTGYNDKYIDDANGETIVHMTKTDGAGTFYEDHTVTMIFMEGIFSRYSNEHVQIKQQETNTVVFDGYTDSNGKITKILEKQVIYDIYLNDVLVHSCRPSDSTYYIMPGSDSGDIIDVPAGNNYNISIEYSDYTNSTYLFEHESEREAIISCDQEFTGKFILVEENPDDGTVQYTQLWEGTVPEGTSRIAGNTSHDYILRSPTSIYHIDMSEKHTDWILSAVVLIMTIILGSMAGSYNPEAGALSATVMLWVAYLFEIPILTFGHLTVITMIVAAALIGKHARKEGV